MMHEIIIISREASELSKNFLKKGLGISWKYVFSYSFAPGKINKIEDWYLCTAEGGTDQ